MSFFLVRLRMVVAAILLLTTMGCNPPAEDSITNAVAVRGMLTKNGVPLEVAGREIGTGMVSLTFIPANFKPEGEQTFATVADEQGNFNLPGGMPAGEYRVAVRQWEPYPQTDKLGGKYDEKNTTIKVEINGRDALKIDLE